MSKHLGPGEVLHAVINVNDGNTGGSTVGTAVNSSGRYRAEHGIEERGLNGHFALSELWLALTDRRLMVFTGSWFTFAHKPKQFVTDVPLGEFTLTWRDDRAMTDFRLLHFSFPDDEEIVRMGEADDESDRFIAALGRAASPMPT